MPSHIAAVAEDSLEDRLSQDLACSAGSVGHAEWEALIEHNLGWLRGWVRGRVKDVDLADDICQDALLKALRSRKKLKDVSRFPSWLYRIAMNTLRDHVRASMRRRKRFKVTSELEDVAAPAGGSAGSALEAQEEAERLLSLVRQLPPRYREPLLLRHAQDLSYSEIGGILGISENAVQVRVFRARKMLREKGAQP